MSHSMAIAGGSHILLDQARREYIPGRNYKRNASLRGQRGQVVSYFIVSSMDLMTIVSR